jgi:hypothetical protein
MVGGRMSLRISATMKRSLSSYVRLWTLGGVVLRVVSMRNDHAHHHHHVFARAAHHHFVQHATLARPGRTWYVHAIESFSHFSVGWLLAGMGYLLGRSWLPVGPIAASALAVLAGGCGAGIGWSQRVAAGRFVSASKCRVLRLSRLPDARGRTPQAPVPCLAVGRAVGVVA